MGTNDRALLDELLGENLGSAAGGRKPRRGPALSLEVVRPLEPGDLARIEDTPSEGPRTLQTIRNTHHTAAKLLAEGLPNVEVSLATGYSPAYLSMLRSDPTFAELVSFYESQVEQSFADMMDRAKALGLSFMDALQQDLENDPTKFTVREKMDAIELFAVKFGNTKGQAGPSGGRQAPLALQVNFVSGRPDEKIVEGKILENQP